MASKKFHTQLTPPYPQLDPNRSLDEHLLALAASPNTTWLGDDILHEMKNLLIMGANPNAEDEDESDVLTHMRLRDGYDSMILKVGQLLHEAGGVLRENTLRLLMEKGSGNLVSWAASVAPVDEIPEDLLHDLIYSKEGYLAVPVLMARQRVDVNFKNDEGQTPLHQAAMRANGEMLWALLDAGADYTILNDAQQSVLDVCSEDGRKILAPELAIRARATLQENTPPAPIRPGSRL